jgi:hypothetical protein
MPDFLILKNLFEKSIAKVIDPDLNLEHIGKVFSSKRKGLNKVKVVEFKAKEYSLYPESLWQQIVVV